MSKLTKDIDATIKELIEDFGEYQVWIGVLNIKRNAPTDKKGISEIIDKHFSIFDERRIEFEIDKIVIWCSYNEDSCGFKISVSNNAPFEISIAQFDSYYNPKDLYDSDCAPQVYDVDKKDYFDNDNWEPMQIKTVKNTIKDREKMFKWVLDTVEKLVEEWDKLTNFSNVVMEE